MDEIAKEYDVIVLGTGKKKQLAGGRERRAGQKEEKKKRVKGTRSADSFLFSSQD